MKRSVLLSVYRLASICFAPVAPLFLRWRQRRGKEDRRRLVERMGRPGAARPEGRLAWLHGVSVSESLALLPLVERLAARGFNVLVTSTTASSALVVAARLPGGSFHQYMPIDVPQFLRRFLDHWRPDIGLVAESEIWPNLFVEMHARHVPLVLVNARMSDHSFRRWQRAGGLIKTLMARTELCLAQTNEDGERFQALGAPHVQVTGNLKFDVAPPPADPAALAALAGRAAGRPIWVAGSIHPGEDDVVIEAHAALAPRCPGLLTILMPRHVEHAKAVVDTAMARGLSVTLRSRDPGTGLLSSIYVVDTMGETGLFYRLASVAFIGNSLGNSLGKSLGKSLTARGGQNPIEAAKLGCAILHGPDVGAFREIYETLDKAHGAASVGNADALARVLAILFSDAAKLRQMGRDAAQTVERLGGAADAIMSALEPHIVQMMVAQQ